MERRLVPIRLSVRLLTAEGAERTGAGGAPLVGRTASPTCQRGKGSPAEEGGREQLWFLPLVPRGTLPGLPPAPGRKDTAHDLGRKHSPPPPTHISPRAQVCRQIRSLPNPSSKLFPQQICLRKPAKPSGRPSSWGKRDVAEEYAQKAGVLPVARPRAQRAPAKPSHDPESQKTRATSCPLVPTRSLTSAGTPPAHRASAQSHPRRHPSVHHGCSTGSGR